MLARGDSSRGQLEEVFLPGERAQGPYAADAGARERWRTRYMAALDRMQQAGIKRRPRQFTV
jgi:hypothetical protein